MFNVVKLIYPTTNSLSSKLCAVALLHFKNSRGSKFSWLENVKSILISCGFSGVWDMHTFPNRTCNKTETSKSIFE